MVNRTEFRDWNYDKEYLVRKGSKREFDDMFDLMTRLHNDKCFLAQIEKTKTLVVRMHLLNEIVLIVLN